MRRWKRMAAALLCLCACACLLWAAPVAAKAQGDEYTYTVRFFAGTRGEHKDGKEVVVRKDLHYGDRVTFDPKREVTLVDKKYYVRGIRESGKDNNTTNTTAAPSFEVRGDQDYVVTYGILGNAVEYRVRFVDTDGNELAPEEVYYGNVGDSPAVAYLYIANYLPQAYAITGTLSEDASKNVFTFVYTRMSPEAQQAAQQAYNQALTVTQTPTAPAATPAAPTAPETPEGPGIDAPDPEVPTAPGDAATQTGGEIDGDPEEIISNDPETPLARQDLDNETLAGSGEFAKVLLNIPLSGKVGICSAVFLLGGLGGFIWTRRKRKASHAEPKE